MKTYALVPLVLVALGPLLAAQGVDTIYFSTRFAEAPASGRAGDINSQTAPCNPVTLGSPYGIESAIANSQGISFVHPGVLNATVPFSPAPGTVMTDYVELGNFPQLNLIIGDLDGDGAPHEASNFGGVDALYLPLVAVGRPNNLHEMFVSSYNDSVGSQGFIGTSLTEADMVLFTAAANLYPAPSLPQPPVFFVRQADWEAFFGLTVPNNSIDVNAFTVDPATGDIYASFDGTASSVATAISGAQVVTSPGALPQTVTLNRGDIIRIPGVAYTPSGPYGVVSGPQGGFAELVLNAADVTAMVLAAGGALDPSTSVTPVNVYGLDLDPAGGTANTPAGFVVPHLLFTVDNRGGTAGGTQNLSSTGVYSTQQGGSFAVINGVTLNQPSAVGVRDLSFNPSFYSGPLDALDVVTHTPSLHPLNDRPLHLDAFPTNGILGANGATYSGILTGYISGAAPGALLAIFARVDLVSAGGFVTRFSVAPFVGGFPDLYVDLFGLAEPSCVLAPAGFPFNLWCQIPAVQALLNGGNNPILTWTDPVNGATNGDTCFEVNLGTLLGPGSLPILPPPVITFQALDLSTVRLSSPLAFQFN